MKRAKLSMEGERWVNCPVCNNKIMKARSFWQMDNNLICIEIVHGLVQSHRARNSIYYQKICQV